MKTKFVLSLMIVLFCLPTFSEAAVSVTSTTTPWAYDYADAELGTEIRKKVKYKKSELMNTYTVQNGELYNNNARVLKKTIDDYRIWSLFTGIAGEEFVEKYIGWYTTFRSAKAKTLGTVELLDSHTDAGWGIAVNANAADFENKIWAEQMAAVLLHEFAHLLTLNDEEVNHQKIKARHCTTTYLTLKGCADEDAYINAFVTRFWTVKDFTHRTTDKRYLKDNADNFLTLHAVKNPEEDIAESFTQFVLDAKPTDTKQKKNQKILFFYEYPELVDLRTRIRSELTPYFAE